MLSAAKPHTLLRKIDASIILAKQTACAVRRLADMWAFDTWCPHMVLITPADDQIVKCLLHLTNLHVGVAARRFTRKFTSHGSNDFFNFLFRLKFVIRSKSDDYKPRASKSIQYKRDKAVAAGDPTRRDEENQLSGGISVVPRVPRCHKN